MIMSYAVGALDNMLRNICGRICASTTFARNDAQSCITCANHNVNLIYSLRRHEYVFTVLEYAIGALDNIFITICAKIYTSTPFAHNDAQNCTTCENIHVNLIYTFLNA